MLSVFYPRISPEIRKNKSGNDAPAVRSVSVTDTTSTLFICHFMTDIVV